MASVRQVLPAKAPELKTVRVAAYARVSTGKDAMLQSLSAQVSYFSAYIQRHPGWTFAGVYADEAVTGTQDDRPEFQRLLRDCREGKIDLIVTKAISRFARNTVTLLKTTRELKELGVGVFFQKEGLYSNRGQGEMILTLLAAVAQEESRAVSENCKWRIRSRFKKGELVNFHFMYGYRMHRGKITIAPEEAAVVAWIFDAYLNGLGCEAIAAALRQQDTPTLMGGAWTANRVMRMLKNEKYAGNALLQKRYVTDHITKKQVRNQGQLPRYYAECTHPGIVTPETFEKAQQLIERNRLKNNIAFKPPIAQPLSGKVLCRNCGKPFSRVMRGGQPKWQCATYLRKGRDACPAKQVPEQVLLAFICDSLGWQCFDAQAFQARVAAIHVTSPSTLQLVLADGQVFETAWQNRSRSESWTAEMKQEARERNLRKGNTPCKQPA